MPYDTYAYVVNHINIAIARKKLKIKFKHTKKALEITHLLYQIGYVSHYQLIHEHKQTWIYISITYYKNTPFYKSLRLVSTPSRRHFISLKALRTVQNSIKSSIVLLSTSKGLLTHTEAIKLNTGGLILCIAN